MVAYFLHNGDASKADVNDKAYKENFQFNTFDLNKQTLTHEKIGHEILSKV